MTTRCLTLIVSLVLLTACQTAAPLRTAESRHPAQSIADAYGYQQWNTVERIDFTYHEEVGDRQVQRRWTWEPQADWVTLHSDARGGSMSYQTKAITADAPAETAQAHAWFMHDRRRLLLPLELVWRSAIVTDEGVTALPSGPGEARRLTVTFIQPDGTRQNGELFVDDATHQIVQTLHPSSTPGSRLVTTRWQEYMRVGPIVVAMRRVGADGSVTWFSDVRVKPIGDEKNHFPVPLR